MKLLTLIALLAAFTFGVLHITDRAIDHGQTINQQVAAREVSK